MRDFLFFDFLFANALEYIAYAITCCVVLYLCTRKTIGYIFDPFHFYYTFTFGTSYAIVIILYAHGLVSDYYFSFLALYAILFLFCFILTSSLSSRRARSSGIFYRLTYTCERQEGLLIKFLIFIYFLCAAIYIGKVSTAVFYSSRFEANRGLGGVVRIMDALRLIIAAWLFVYFLRIKKKKYLLGAIFVSLIGALLSGAKFALLEQLYVMFVAGFIAERKKIKLTFGVLFLFLLLGALLLFFVLAILSQTSVAIGYVNSQYIPGAPVTVELLILRVLANGDQYYLSLTNQILENISIQHPLLQMFANTFGNGLMSNLFDFDFANSDVGRQIWLNWYPNDPIMRGPANHFDLTGYVYFGYVGGMIFSCFIGAILGKINGFKKKYIHSSAVAVAFISALYCRSLAIVLNPSVGIAYIIDVFIILILIWIIASVCREVNKSVN
ncbi:hypothetical protein FH968_16280 [Buttiauxella sp. B2]|uniref:hypothetical protein n=1 Tax=Buttiauxella sp. B2 TaxID=2587812 RepID=UPI0011236996|nr:hypothetical protein [Buttiauxella sp. B2]TNV19002.1 hypothetical protein FH968_16280 [Buttiauxella sp. B2]